MNLFNNLDLLTAIKCKFLYLCILHQCQTTPHLLYMISLVAQRVESSHCSGVYTSHPVNWFLRGTKPVPSNRFLTEE